MPVAAKAEGILFHLPFLANAWASAADMLDDQSSSLAFCSRGSTLGFGVPEGSLSSWFVTVVRDFYYERSRERLLSLSICNRPIILNYYIFRSTAYY